MSASGSVEKALSLMQSDQSKILGLSVGNHKVTPGQEIPKAEAQAAPELSFTGASESGTYIAISLDLDAPFPSFAILGPILHWLQPGLKRDTSGSGKLTTSERFVCNYAGPGPPPGSSWHRYVFLLYEQPADFDINKYAPAVGKEVGIMPRIRYNLAAFEQQAKLGPVVAANYFNSK